MHLHHVAMSSSITNFYNNTIYSKTMNAISTAERTLYTSKMPPKHTTKSGKKAITIDGKKMKGRKNPWEYKPNLPELIEP